MKMSILRNAFIGLLMAVAAAAAEEEIKSVKLVEGIVLGEVAGAEPQPLVAEVEFTRGILVQTNGVYRVKEGRERKLKEGQILQRNGMLKSADGSLRPVFDHVTFRGGRVVELRDGLERPVVRPVTLADGTVVSPDASLRRADGVKTRLLEGEIYTLSGVVPTNDTISLRDGMVSVQKNGGAIPVRPRGSIVMEDGTRVYGDGRVVRPNGEKLSLSEGQTIEIPGVVRRLPR